MRRLRPETAPSARAALCCVLVVVTLLGGCVATPAGSGGDATGSATRQATHTTSPILPSYAADRAVEAEQSRVENASAEYPRIASLDFGVVRTPEYELIETNSTGVVVRVEVGYSVELDCNESTAGPEESVDGAATVARYFVSDYDLDLVSVEQRLLDPAAYCG